jgi:hypothetical protein
MSCLFYTTSMRHIRTIVQMRRQKCVRMCCVDGLSDPRKLGYREIVILKEKRKIFQNLYLPLLDHTCVTPPRAGKGYCPDMVETRTQAFSLRLTLDLEPIAQTDLGPTLDRPQTDLVRPQTDLR